MRILRGSALEIIAGASLALGLASCASDDAGRRALAETTTLRAQVDEVQQRGDSNAREIARIQSQIRALESDAAVGGVALASSGSGAIGMGGGDGVVGAGGGTATTEAAGGAAAAVVASCRSRSAWRASSRSTRARASSTLAALTSRVA